MDRGRVFLLGAFASTSHLRVYRTTLSLTSFYKLAANGGQKPG